MKKLSTQQLKDHIALTSRLEQAKTKVVMAQDALRAATEKFNAILEEYNGVLADANSFRDQITADMDYFLEERSERWAESDAGEAYTNWHDAWEGIDLDPLDQHDLPDFQIIDHAEEWDELPASPE